ncbi:MAG: hypothetical protein ACPG8W_01875 [Candidatus Promineifilaceae bacterium]
MKFWRINFATDFDRELMLQKGQIAWSTSLSAAKKTSFAKKLQSGDGVFMGRWHLQKGSIEAVGRVTAIVPHPTKTFEVLVDWVVLDEPRLVKPTPKGKADWQENPIFQFDSDSVARYDLLDLLDLVPLSTVVEYSTSNLHQVTLFSDGDQPFFQWMAENPRGHVVNISSTAGGSTCVLHESGCWHLAGLSNDQRPDGYTKYGFNKLCSYSLPALLLWLDENRPKADGFAHVCGTCLRGFQPPKPSDIDPSIVNNTPSHTELSRTRGLQAFPHLVRAAMLRETPTYGEIGAKIDVHHRVTSHFLAYIRDAICIPNGYPLLTAIVVTANGIPGNNFLPEGTDHLSEEDYRTEFERHRDKVFAFKGWDGALVKLGLEPIEFDEGALKKLAIEQNNYWARGGGRGGGEGEEHQNLKLYAAEHPEQFGLSASIEPKLEHIYLSGDRCDILFRDADKHTVIEIKTGNPKGELVRGVYQLVKYRALSLAEGAESCTAILVAHVIPSDVERLAKKLTIECVVIPYSAVS